MLWVTSARVNHAMGACGGRERRAERTAGGQRLALASAATAPHTHPTPPHRTHTPDPTGTQLNLREGCFGSAFAFRGFRVVAAEGRQRGLREGRAGHSESDRQEGGGPTNYGACGRGVTRSRLRSLRGYTCRGACVSLCRSLGGSAPAAGRGSDRGKQRAEGVGGRREGSIGAQGRWADSAKAFRRGIEEEVD